MGHHSPRSLVFREPAGFFLHRNGDIFATVDQSFIFGLVGPSSGCFVSLGQAMVCENALPQELAARGMQMGEPCWRLRRKSHVKLVRSVERNSMKNRPAQSSTATAVARFRRPGLTLLELIVVLAILAAVAAIIAPLLPNLLRRAHKATDATQTSELSKAVQTYNALYYSYPSNFDLLTTGTAFPAYLPGGSTTPFGGFVQLGTLTSAEADALNSVGITSVQKLATTATQPTLNPYPTNTITGMTTDAVLLSTESASPTNSFAIIDFNSTSGTAILAANPAFLQSARAADPTARYVVFGVGARSQMIGQVIQDAPTSVPQKKGFTPANTYSRVGVIFKVSGVEVANADNRAKFIGAVALEDDELEATEKDVIGFYEVSAGTGN
jgi:type IV pilus assembly protein PilA